MDVNTRQKSLPWFLSVFSGQTARSIRYCLSFAVFMFLAACSNSTGLQSLNSQQSLQSHYRQISQNWLTELRQRQVIYRDAQAEQIIEPVMQRLVPQYSRLGINVHLAHLPGENAIALPDGTLVIHQSMLAALASEEQLAFLLAHEVSHHLLNHAWYSAQYHGERTSIAGSFKYSGGAHSGAFDRGQEQQADDYAVKLMIRAGYDIREAAGFFEQLRQYPLQYAGGNEARTHPSLQQRQLHLQRLARSYASERSNSSNSTSPDHYHRFRLNQLVISIDRKIKEPDLQGALVQLAELEQIQGRTSISDCLRADVYRAIGDDLVTASQAFSEITGKRIRSNNSSIAQQYFMQRANSVLREGLLRSPESECIRDRV